MRDITSRRQAEDSLHRAKSEAERANLSKSKFLAAASHDLRQPLQATYLFMEILRRHVSNDGLDALDHVQQGLNVLTELLNRLLDVSRLDAGAVHPLMQPTVLNDVLADIEAGYAAAAAAKGIGWRAAGCPLPVRTDPVLLSQMLRNLIDNAVKYTRSGEISIDCQEAGDRVRITVRDTGIGIPEDHLGLVFEEFHQVDNPERDRTKGLGLGLAIVRRLSILLDHPVEVRSQPGIGTEFVILLPIAFDSVRANDNHGAAGGAAGEEVPAGPSGRFVVLVDDDVVVLRALEAMLRSWGLEVLAAQSSADAVDGLRRLGRQPDLILCDYRLREGRVGTEAVRSIREIVGADVPALIITGETGGEALHDAAAQRLPVLHKPVPPGVLRREMERHFGVA
ncbi:hybrid sensor histidine kinase/response regulator [Azospirillum thermophilum]|uniref:histidine kinase n=2 Tax=Azospirillum thermophilum TaxID=2202148 RepID=A0A2S2CVP0_9PROT|nr:hybrid sensor histidine kinase/response regulator [Azospirillum thermophilum]